MSAKKKMAIIIVALCIAIVTVISAIVVILVESNQTANASISVTYEANDVSATIWANAHVGTSITHSFVTANGVDHLSLSPQTQDTGSLSQPSNVEYLIMDRVNQSVVFEYIFRNDSSDIDINIGLESIPGDVEDQEARTNIKIQYVWSDTVIEDYSNLELVDDYGNENGIVELKANATANAMKYIYIVVSIDKLLYNAEFRGNFSWSLNKA